MKPDTVTAVAKCGDCGAILDRRFGVELSQKESVQRVLEMSARCPIYGHTRYTHVYNNVEVSWIPEKH